jgi:cytochrome c556
MRLPSLIASCAVLIATASIAHENVQNQMVRARMAHMTMIAQHTETLGKMAKGVAAFDPQTANAALATIAASARDIPDYFEDPATDPKSEARPEIWESWDRFTAMSLALASASDTRIEVADDLRPALAEIGAACRACHESYRD